MLGLLISAVAVTILLWLRRAVYERLTARQRRVVLVAYLIASAAVVVALYNAQIHLSQTDVIGLIVGAAVAYGLVGLLWDHQPRNQQSESER